MKLLLLVLVLIPSTLYAETKYDLARKLFHTSEFESSLSDTEKLIEGIRQSTIKRFTHKIEPDKKYSAEVILQSKKLESDLQSSDLFKVNREELREWMIKAFAKSYSYEVLQELNGEPSPSLKRKLAQGARNIAFNFMEFAKILNARNAPKIKAFEERYNQIRELKSQSNEPLKLTTSTN